MDFRYMTVAEISAWLADNPCASREIFRQLALDPRAGVRQLGEQWRKRRITEVLERRRVSRLHRFERAVRRQGFKLIAGIDEAGRGPLAGPVVAAAVILPPDIHISGIDDSKKLTEAERNMLFAEIQKTALAVGVGIVDNQIIDAINILQATLRAMERAVADLAVRPEVLLVDALRIPGVEIPQEGIIGGDGQSISIAAASIVAKVTRDRIMEQWDRTYPQYGFARHKGYPTSEHLAALARFGPTPIHRRSFAPIKAV